MDYDFTFLRAQSIAALIPAILPVAETTNATPAEIVAAYIIGAEVAARFVRPDQNGPTFDGWHATGMVGVLGVAAACARLMQVRPKDIPNVMGIAASLASGVTANYGTMTKPLHCGNAARNGVLAAIARQVGLHRQSGGIRRTQRIFPVVLPRHRRVARRLQGFRRALRPARRPPPLQAVSVRRAHPHLDRGGDDLRRVSPGASTRSKISIALSRAPPGSAPRPPGRPTTKQAKFSVGYLVPYALVHGAPRIAAFTKKALDDDRLKALQPKVTASVDPDLGRGDDDSPARIRITMNDGEVFELRKDFSTGSHMLPMPQAQLEEKFHDCAALVMDKGRAAKIFAILNELPDRASFADFWPLFRKA